MSTDLEQNHQNTYHTEEFKAAYFEMTGGRFELLIQAAGSSLYVSRVYYMQPGIKWDNAEWLYKHGLLEIDKTFSGYTWDGMRFYYLTDTGLEMLKLYYKKPSWDTR